MVSMFRQVTGTQPTYVPDVRKEFEAKGLGLGRIHMPDTRDYGNLMRMPTALPAIYSKIWRTREAWDQGGTSMCVAYSGLKLLTASPIINDIPDGESFATVYKWCQENDEWPGEDYDGTSVRAFQKWAMARGLTSGYVWGYDNLPIISHVLTIGPVQVGTDWTVPMFTVDGKEFIHVAPGGRYDVAGGHAWLIKGLDRRKKCPDGTKGAYRGLTSWGDNFGDRSEFWISFADFTILLNNRGEGAVTTEVQRPRVRRRKAA